LLDGQTVEKSEPTRRNSTLLKDHPTKAITVDPRINTFNRWGGHDVISKIKNCE